MNKKRFEKYFSILESITQSKILLIFEDDNENLIIATSERFSKNMCLDSARIIMNLVESLEEKLYDWEGPVMECGCFVSHDDGEKPDIYH